MFTKNKRAYANECLVKIDSLLKQNLVQEPATFNFRDCSKNGGHIPGRFMAKCIQKAGLMKDCVERQGDPLSFFELYQKAVQKLGLATGLSDASLLYLHKVYGRR